MKKHLNRALGFTLSAAVAVSVLAAGASAIEYTAPTTGVIANDSVLLGTSSSAGTTLLSMLGVNVAASGTSNGIIDNNTDSTEWGSGSQHLGIFGSDINDNPDPYLYNYFYNYNSTKSGGGTYSQEAYTAWNATTYSLIGAPSSTVTISIDGVTKTCSPYFFYEPEIHVVMTTDPTSALAAYQESYNENYDPIIVQAGNTGNAARITGLPVNYNMFVMSERTVEVGRMVDELAETEGRMTRYANSAWEIASDYDKWCRGYYYWAQLMFEVHDGTLTDDEVAALESYGVDIDALGGGLEKVRGIHSFSYDSDTDSWTIGIASSSGGSAQFAVGIVDDVYDVLTEEIATGVETDYVVTTAELIEYLTPEGNRPGVVVGNVSDSVRETLEDAGIRIISNLPSAVYGISTGSARERAIGQPYYLGFFYYDQLAAMTNVDMTLNPISMIFYWMKNFYHVSDNDAMQQVVVNMLETSDLPEGLVVSDSATTDSFGSDVEAAIENMIVLGMKYYLAVEEPRLDAGGVWDPETSIAYWLTLTDAELAMGIGSGDIYLNPEGNGVENRHLNAQNYASDGTVETFYTEYSSYVKDGTSMELQAGSGDVNGDGSVTTVDAVIVLRYETGTVELTSAQIAAADISGDSEVKTNDAVLILQTVVSGA